MSTTEIQYLRPAKLNRLGESETGAGLVATQRKKIRYDTVNKVNLDQISKASGVRLPEGFNRVYAPYEGEPAMSLYKTDIKLNPKFLCSGHNKDRIKTKTPDWIGHHDKERGVLYCIQFAPGVMEKMAYNQLLEGVDDFNTFKTHYGNDFIKQIHVYRKPAAKK